MFVLKHLVVSMAPCALAAVLLATTTDRAVAASEGKVVSEKGQLFLIDPDLPHQTRVNIGFGADVARFAKEDKKRPPQQGGILFIGSSTFTAWQDVADYFKPLPVTNRAFGGSCVWELWYWADHIVLPYAPRTIVVYIGDNDLEGLTLSAGKGVNRVADPKAVRFYMKYVRLLVERVRAKLPNTRFVFVSVKPSVARWLSWPNVVKPANHKLATYCRHMPNMAFVDTTGIMLGEDGKPKAELFQADGLHFKHSVYADWARVMRKKLGE